METGKLEYLKIKNITDQTADIYFYGEIVGDEWSKWTNADTCPQDVIDALNAAEGKNLNVYINSPGGSVFAGVAIYNMLSRHKGKKTVYVDGMAASIASVIAMAGDEIVIPSNAYLMIHNPLCCVCGNASELRKMADDLDIIRMGMEDIYKTKLKHGVGIDDIIKLMDAETWMTGEQAAKYYEITVSKPVDAVACAPEWIKGFARPPEALKKQELESKQLLKNELAMTDSFIFIEKMEGKMYE